MSDVVAPVHLVSEPPSNLYDTIACVAEHLTDACDVGTRIWIDSASGGTYDIGVWETVSNDNSLLGGFIIVQATYTTPTMTPYCLKKTAYKIIDQ